MAVGGLILGITAIFLPPLVVFWRRGCSAHFLINIGLLFLGWIPAVLHAWFVILDSPSLRQRQRNRSVGHGGRSRSPMRMSQETGSTAGYATRPGRRRSGSRSRGGGYYREERYAPTSAYPDVQGEEYRRRY